MDGSAICLTFVHVFFSTSFDLSELFVVRDPQIATIVSATQRKDKSD